ncbi:MAG: hypothetical protein ACXU82_17385 [Caulobacteraceae bacterium]
MTTIIRPGAGILFMKVGTHAREPLTDIITRKTKEIEETGFGMWGYGGNTCHPRTMVQPFAEEVEQRGEPIFLCMQEMASNHWAEPTRAEQYSVDGLKWQDIPETINVTGSRFALMIKSLREEEHELPLDQTRVPIGPNTGRLGSRYLKGRVDKACLEVMDHVERPNEGAPAIVRINLVAELATPFAVFLRDPK